MQKGVIMKCVWAILITGIPLLGFTQDTAQTALDTVFCGDTRIVFYSRCLDDTATKISFVHVHENETTAVAAANLLMDTLQRGCFTTWQCQQQRFVEFKLKGVQYRFDPNRIYTQTGIKTTLKSNKGAFSDSAMLSIQVIADVFLRKYIDSNRLIVALHNNTDAGGLSISSYKKGNAFSSAAKQVFINPKQDADDFFYTTEVAYFNFLKTKGFNVVLQDNVKVPDDGSLSVYAATYHIPYINIEAQNGHLQQQIKMLSTVFQLIDAIIKSDFMSN